jgi:5-methylcytosine-specific restriction endonuclease McrA
LPREEGEGVTGNESEGLYFICEVLCTEEIEVSMVAAIYSTEGSGEYGHRTPLTDELKDLLIRLGHCYSCGASIAPDFRSCDCEEYDFLGEHLNIALPPGDGIATFSELWLTAKARSKQRRRRALVKENGGVHKKADIGWLFELQQGMCFYCGRNLVEDHSRARYHADHYLSLFSGGGNDITNLVLACATCNLDKGAKDPDAFKRRIGRRLDERTRARLRQMRADLRRGLRERNGTDLGKRDKTRD